MFEDEQAALAESITADDRVEQMAEALRAEQDTNLILQESMADLELALEDRGWQTLQGVAAQDFSRAGLGRASDMARVYAVINPLIKRGLALRIAYVWGQGVSVAARSTGNEGDQDINAVIQAFLDDPSNRASFTAGQSREELERALGTDGNVFLACVTNPLNGRVQVRSVPFSQVQDIITNPEDADEPWFYLREWQTTAVMANGLSTATVNQTRRAYYPALGYRPTSRPNAINGIPVEWAAPIQHVSVNRLDGWLFGIGDAFAALPWARSYKDFLTDWAKLVKSLSRFAWRLSADKSSKAQTAAAKIRSAVQAGQAYVPGDIAGTMESAAGATAAMSAGANLEAIPKSGATIDSLSGKPLAAMAASALGVPVTMLLMEPGHTGARAVAETLDHPTELEMKLRQELWQDQLLAIFGYVIDQSIRAPQGLLKGTVARDSYTGREVMTLTGDQDRTIDVVWPDMTAIDPLQLIQAIVAADGTGKMPPKETMRLLLEALGVDDIDDLLKEYTDDAGNFVPPEAAANASAGQAAVDAFRQGQDPASAVA